MLVAERSVAPAVVKRRLNTSGLGGFLPDVAQKAPRAAASTITRGTAALCPASGGALELCSLATSYGRGLSPCGGPEIGTAQRRRQFPGCRIGHPNFAGPCEAAMLLLLIGATLAIVGIVLLAAPPIWRDRLSGGRPRATAGATLEPRRPGAGFKLATNGPGLALLALGGVLLLAAAFLH